MRISDGSSGVCSSDLARSLARQFLHPYARRVGAVEMDWRRSPERRNARLRPPLFPPLVPGPSGAFHRRRESPALARHLQNHFRPDTAIAATRLLESAGYSVAIPDRPLCCGRPLYAWGFLDEAKA